MSSSAPVLPPAQAVTISEEQKAEWKETFTELSSPADNNGCESSATSTNGNGSSSGTTPPSPSIDGTLALGHLQEALSRVGFRLPAWRVRDIVDRMDRGQGGLTREEFEKICADQKARDFSSTFKKKISKKENVETIVGSTQSNEGTTHSVRNEEEMAFANWINSNLANDKDVQHLLPLSPDGKDLYQKVTDGILIVKMINHSCPDTIDERAVNMTTKTVYAKHENLTLALNSAQSIGCNVVNIDANDMIQGKPHLVLGLLWQIIRLGLFNQITLDQCPGLAILLENSGEKVEDLMKMSPEAILLRWANHQLERSGAPKRINNFSNDISDSEAYTHLLYQIAPLELGVTKEALMESDNLSRAETMLQQADKLGCRSFISPKDVVEGIYKLNMAFVANLFNNHPGLDSSNIDLEDYANVEESREEKTYRNWMNSLGVSPYVNNLSSDLADGLIIFQLYDIINPGVVQWTKVTRKFSRMKKFMEKLENCNYVVELGRRQKFSLVGIAGQDINDGNSTLTLALVWQLMRSYTLSVLSSLNNQSTASNASVEQEIVKWVNTKLESAQKDSKIHSFQDSKIATAKPIIDLIDAIKPGVINYELLQEGGSYEEDLANAKYALSMARRIGARVYALPEDVVEVKHKMVMTVFACLMSKDYVPNMDSKKKASTASLANNGNGDVEAMEKMLAMVAASDK
jgi:plastin-3